MKPGLSLRMSQHLALTPQLQQSIRLLQLSTLELTQEVDQMLDENPFLERAEEEAPAEAFGQDQADTYVSQGDRVSESASTTTGRQRVGRRCRTPPKQRRGNGRRRGPGPQHGIAD